MRIFDWHCDTILGNVMEHDQSLERNDGQVDLERMRAAGALAQVFALFGQKEAAAYRGKRYSPWEYVLLQHDVFCEQMKRFPNEIAPALCADDVLKNEAEGKISALLSLEGGIPIDGKMERIDALYVRGVRLITLTWNDESPFGYPNSRDDAVMQKELKPFGIDAVAHMNELGVLIDVSHLSDGGFYDVARYSEKPFIASHSCCRALCDHPRCLTDEMLHFLGDAGGVCGVNFYSFFLKEGNRDTTIELVVRHMLHIRDKAGIDALCFGSDFDGIGGCTLEFRDYAGFPRILNAMERHFSDGEIEKICRGNAMRILRDVVG